MKGMTNAAAYLSESEYAYGVEWDDLQYAPAMTRIGNPQLHRDLPIQSKMRGCLITDLGEKTYLPNDAWPAELTDGTHGQVMVEVPSHYRKFETSGTKHKCWLSEFPLVGYHAVPTYYVGAYEAVIDKASSDWRFASVANDSANYRYNKPEWDGTYRSMLGRPSPNIPINEARIYASRRGGKWALWSYKSYKSVVWLAVVEYATRNLQWGINPLRDSNGFAQGGLGSGVTTWTNWTACYNFNQCYPFIPCGHTNSLGNYTGERVYDVKDEAGGILSTVYANRYRGIENIFGHTMKFVDGAIIDYDGGLMTLKVSASHQPLTTDYRVIGEVPVGSGYLKAILGGDEGDIIPSELGGSSNTYWSDAVNVVDAAQRVLRFGGSMYSGAEGGILSVAANFEENNRGENSTHRIGYYGTF